MRHASLALQRCGIRPTLPRLAVAKVMLANHGHPSADQVWELVKTEFPAVSRATVYNVLELFAARGLVRRRIISGPHAVYDPVTARHHHLVDEASGRVYDIPWEAVSLPEHLAVPGFDVAEFYLVIKGTKKRRGRKPNHGKEATHRQRGRARAG